MAFERVDHFWKSVFKLKSPDGSERFTLLALVAMSGLVMSQTNAESERSLSINNRIVTKDKSHLREDTGRDWCTRGSFIELCDTWMSMENLSEEDNLRLIGGRKKKSNRRSSILKPPRSPGRSALEDIDSNSADDRTTNFKRSSKRVSFAQTSSVKEFAEVTDTDHSPLHVEASCNNDTNTSTTPVGPAVSISGLDCLISGQIESDVLSSASNNTADEDVARAVTSDGFDPSVVEMPDNRSILQEETGSSRVVKANERWETGSKAEHKVDTSQFLKKIMSSSSKGSVSGILYKPSPPVKQISHRDLDTRIKTCVNKYLSQSSSILMAKTQQPKYTTADKTVIFDGQDDSMELTQAFSNSALPETTSVLFSRKGSTMSAMDKTRVYNQSMVGANMDLTTCVSSIQPEVGGACFGEETVHFNKENEDDGMEFTTAFTCQINTNNQQPSTDHSHNSSQRKVDRKNFLNAISGGSSKNVRSFTSSVNASQDRSCNEKHVSEAKIDSKKFLSNLVSKQKPKPDPNQSSCLDIKSELLKSLSRRKEQVNDRDENLEETIISGAPEDTMFSSSNFKNTERKINTKVFLNKLMEKKPPSKQGGVFERTMVFSGNDEENNMSLTVCLGDNTFANVERSCEEVPNKTILFSAAKTLADMDMTCLPAEGASDVGTLTSLQNSSMETKFKSQDMGSVKPTDMSNSVSVVHDKNKTIMADESMEMTQCASANFTASLANSLFANKDKGQQMDIGAKSSLGPQTNNTIHFRDNSDYQSNMDLTRVPDVQTSNVTSSGSYPRPSDKTLHFDADKTGLGESIELTCMPELSIDKENMPPANKTVYFDNTTAVSNGHMDFTCIKSQSNVDKENLPVKSGNKTIIFDGNQTGICGDMELTCAVNPVSNGQMIGERTILFHEEQSGQPLDLTCAAQSKSETFSTSDRNKTLHFNPDRTNAAMEITCLSQNDSQHNLQAPNKTVYLHNQSNAAMNLTCMTDTYSNQRSKPIDNTQYFRSSGMYNAMELTCMDSVVPSDITQNTTSVLKTAQQRKNKRKSVGFNLDENTFHSEDLSLLRAQSSAAESEMQQGVIEMSVPTADLMNEEVMKDEVKQDDVVDCKEKVEDVKYENANHVDNAKNTLSEMPLNKSNSNTEEMLPRDSKEHVDNNGAECGFATSDYIPKVKPNDTHPLEMNNTSVWSVKETFCDVTDSEHGHKSTEECCQNELPHLVSPQKAIQEINGPLGMQPPNSECSQVEVHQEEHNETHCPEVELPQKGAPQNEFTLKVSPQRECSENETLSTRLFARQKRLHKSVGGTETLSYESKRLNKTVSNFENEQEGTELPKFTLLPRISTACVEKKVSRELYHSKRTHSGDIVSNMENDKQMRTSRKCESAENILDELPPDLLVDSTADTDQIHMHGQEEVFVADTTGRKRSIDLVDREDEREVTKKTKPSSASSLECMETKANEIIKPPTSDMDFVLSSTQLNSTALPNSEARPLLMDSNLSVISSAIPSDESIFGKGPVQHSPPQKTFTDKDVNHDITEHSEVKSKKQLPSEDQKQHPDDEVAKNDCQEASQNTTDKQSEAKNEIEILWEELDEQNIVRDCSKPRLNSTSVLGALERSRHNSAGLSRSYHGVVDSNSQSRSEMVSISFLTRMTANEVSTLPNLDMVDVSKLNLKSMDDYFALFNIQFFEKNTRRSTMVPMAASEPTSVFEILSQLVKEPYVSTYEWACQQLTTKNEQFNAKILEAEEEMLQCLPSIFKTAPGDNHTMEMLAKMKSTCRKRSEIEFKQWKNKMLQSISATLQEEAGTMKEGLTELAQAMRDIDSGVDVLLQEKIRLDEKEHEFDNLLQKTDIVNEFNKKCSMVIDLEESCKQLERKRMQEANANRSLKEQLRQLEEAQQGLSEGINQPPGKVLKQFQEQQHILKSCGFVEVKHWSDTSAKLLIFQDTMELRIEFGDVLNEEWWQGQSHRKITTLSLASLLKDTSSTSVLLAHKLILTKYTNEILMQNCQDTRLLAKMLQDMSATMLEARQLVWDLEENVVGEFHKSQVILESNSIRTVYSSLKCRCYFEVEFVIDLHHYPNNKLAWKAKVIFGSLRADDLELCLSRVEPGSAYIKRCFLSLNELVRIKISEISKTVLC